MTSSWLPEAIDPTHYAPNTRLADRSIDVLEMGRSYAHYHQAIKSPLSRMGAVHVYSRSPGSLIFPSRKKLVDGLSNTKVSVCFPSSVTHPQRSGDVETVTYRYFEAMASKCVVLGACPAELVDLFGYNPCVEADFARPVEQIQELLYGIGSWQSLVDRNYQRLLEVGTSQVRARTLLDALAYQGYEVPLGGESKGVR